jgi:hypothetical protein
MCCFGLCRDIADHLIEVYQVSVPLQSSGGARHRAGAARVSPREQEKK